ncbi:hypothetical protein D3C73_308950 [compost metagenome]
MKATAKTFLVWTELTESLHPTRKAGTKVYAIYETAAPKSWVEKGYIRDAEEEDMDEGQVDLFEII